MTFADDEGFDGDEFRGGRGREWSDEGDEDYRRARKRVRRLMGFYRHLATAATIFLGLLIIDLIFDPDDFWVHWVAIIWGIILVVHGLNVFLFDSLLGREAERRMIEREIRRQRPRG